MRGSFASVLAAIHLIACAPETPAASPDAEATAPEAEAIKPSDSESTDPAAGETTQTSGTENEGEAKPDEPASSEQPWLRVGEVTDGATLTSAEVTTGPASGATLVLTFDGKGPPPATRARVENPKLVVVVVEGVRGMKANLPLVTGEGFRVVGTPRKIERGPIQTIGRGFYGDDSGIRIDVELSKPSTLELVPGATGRSVELRVTPGAA